MDYKISSAEELGALVRAVRKAQGLRQDDAAGSIGLSENFPGKVERGAGRFKSFDNRASLREHLKSVSNKATAAA